jgi:hypothetical protein
MVGRNRFSSIIFLILLGFAVLMPLYGRGSREDPIAVSRRLIEERQFNQALDILTEFIRTEPDRINEAEALLRNIRSIRNVYNDLGRQLVDTLENDPENFERAVSLIDRMNELDNNPNPRTAEQLNEARRTAKLQVDRARRDSIFAQASASISQGQYAQAIELYLSGLDLQRPEFLEDGYTEQIYTLAQEATRGIEQFARQGLELFPQWLNAFDQFSIQLDLANQSITQIESQVPSEIDQLGWDFQGLFNENLSETQIPLETFLREGNRYVSAFFELVDGIELAQNLDPRLIDHLVFLQQFIQGRTTFANEGIAGLLEFLLERALEDLTNQIIGQAQTMIERSGVLFDQSNNSSAAALGQRIVETALVGLEIRFAFRDEQFNPLAGNLDDPSVQLQTIAHHGLFFHTQGLIENQIAQRIVADSQINPNLVEDFLTSLSTYQEINQVLEQRSQFFAQTHQLINDPQLIEEYEEWQRDLQSRLGIRNQVQLAGLLELYESETLVSLDQLDFQVRSANNQIQGQANDEGVILRFPNRALESLDQARVALNRARELQENVQDLFEVFPELRSLPRAQESLSFFSQNLQRQTNLASQEAALRTDAQGRIAQSLVLRQQGQNLVNQSRTATQALNINLARTRFEEARNAYFQSLELQEDPEFRAQVDQIILVLGDDIRAAQNQVIVLQVRDLLTRGRNAYNLGDFNNALAIVVEAEELWSITNTEPNQELVTLRDRISSATTLAQERELSEFDPLFPTISQFLNLARLEIEAGTRLLNAGNTQQALTRFANAEANIENVLFVKPFNFEARILQIRIIQITRANEFQELFSRRFTDTLARINTAAPIEVLTELQVLAQINPRYPGLQQNIQTLEIRLGLREDPLTRQRIDESNRLLAQARTLSANTNDRATLTAALNLVEQAAILNRDNSQAQLLADTLRIHLGGQASFALSSGDEQLFRRAESLFVQGSIAEAYAIVLQLLQNTTNQGYPPLLSLRDRIERRL